MAIIIRDGDIINVSDQNILLNNRVRQVKTQEKIIEVGEKQVNTDRDVNGLYTTSINRNSQVFIYATTKGRIRIEAYQTIGSFTVSKSQFPYVTSDNIQWTMTGKYLQRQPTHSNSPTYREFTDVSEGCKSPWDSSTSGGTAFQQVGYWGENGVVKYYGETGRRENTPLKYNDFEKSYVSVTDNGNSYTINYHITTEIEEMSFSTWTSWDSPVDYYFQKEYWIETIRFDLYVNDVTEKNENIVNSMGDNAPNETFTIPTNTLYQKKTLIDGETAAIHNSNEILSDWGNGRETATIDVVVGDYYDESGNLVISAEDSTKPSVFKIGDMVVPYVKQAYEFEKDGEHYAIIKEEGISSSKDDIPKRFIIYDKTIIDDGVTVQRLKLIESAILRALNVTVVDNVTLVVTRTSSPTASAPIGVIDTSKSTIYLNDTAQIEYILGENFPRGYKITLLLNMEEVANNSSHIVDGDWNIETRMQDVPAYTLTMPTDLVITPNVYPKRHPSETLTNNSTIYEDETISFDFVADIYTLYKNASITNNGVVTWASANEAQEQSASDMFFAKYVETETQGNVALSYSLTSSVEIIEYTDNPTRIILTYPEPQGNICSQIISTTRAPIKGGINGDANIEISVIVVWGVNTPETVRVVINSKQISPTNGAIKGSFMGVKREQGYYYLTTHIQTEEEAFSEEYLAALGFYIENGNLVVKYTNSPRGFDNISFRYVYQEQ